MDLSIYPRPSVSHRLVNILQIPVIWWMLQHWAMSLSPKEDKIIPFQFSNWKVVLLRVWLECHQDWWNIMTCCLTISLSVVLEREREREREREWIWTSSVYLLQVIQHIGRGFMKIWTSEINHFIRILNVVHSWVDRISTPYCNPNRVLNYQNIIKQIWQKSNGLKISSFVALTE